MRLATYRNRLLTRDISALSLRVLGSVKLHSTLSRDVTERDSPTLSQTSHGQWVKRERLGTRLRISDTRLTSLRLVFWRIAPWGCLRSAIAFLGPLWYMKSPERLYDKRPLPSSKNPHFQTEAKCTAFLVKMSFVWMRMKNHFHIKGQALNLVWIQRPGELRNVVKIHEIVPNKKSLFPFFSLLMNEMSAQARQNFIKIVLVWDC